MKRSKIVTDLPIAMMSNLYPERIEKRHDDHITFFFAKVNALYVIEINE